MKTFSLRYRKVLPVYVFISEIRWKRWPRWKSWGKALNGDNVIAFQLWCSSPTAVKGIQPVPHPVWPIVKYVHQLESVAIRQTWCEHVRQSICWHGGQRYVINADFTLHWVELATLATTSMLIHPIKSSLFIYLQHQPPDMRGMNPPLTFQTHWMLIYIYVYFFFFSLPVSQVKETFHFSGGIFTFCLTKFTQFSSFTHVCTLSV